MVLRKWLAFLLCLFLCAFVAYLSSLPPRFYIGQAHPADVMVGQILAQTSGRLPKEQADLAGVSGEHSTVALYTVDAWTLDSVHVSRPFGQRLLDDDPKYIIKALLRVRYTDGSAALLQWRSWQNGLILGPFVIRLGDGPPGTVTPYTSASNSS